MNPTSRGCFAVDVVQAGLDPLTGRTLSFNHVPMAAWAGHLCDLVLLGVLADREGVAVALGPVPDEVHPLVAAAWTQVSPRTPRAWGRLFGPQTVDVNDVAADARTWLVEVGVWTRHHGVFGTRFHRVEDAPPVETPAPPGPAALRAQVLRILVGLAQVGDVTAGPPTPTSLDGDADTTVALRTVLGTTSALIAWKTAQPPLLHGGM